MMRSSLAGLACAALLAGCGRNAAAEQLERFGLIGRWAPDCTRPASRDNAVYEYAVAPDGPTLGVSQGEGAAGRKTVPIETAEPVAGDRIRVTALLRNTFIPLEARNANLLAASRGDVRSIMVIERLGNAVRILDTTQVYGVYTKAMARDGFVLDPNGTPTLPTEWLTRCGTR